jgi:hypothetical protein
MLESMGIKDLRVESPWPTSASEPKIVVDSSLREQTRRETPDRWRAKHLSLQQMLQAERLGLG